MLFLQDTVVKRAPLRRGRVSLWAIGVAAAVALQPALVRAEGAAPGAAQTSKARTHFTAGEALYQLGNYTGALREFSAGYDLVARPEFLVNLGQCYRRLGNLKRARDMYQKYLDTAPAGAPQRAEVAELVAELDEELRRNPPASTATQGVPTAAPASAQAGAGGANSGAGASAAVPVASGAATRPEAVTSGTAEHRGSGAAPADKSFIRRHWWIIPVAVLVAGGLAVGLGVGLTRGAGDPCGRSNVLSCREISALSGAP